MVPLETESPTMVAVRSSERGPGLGASGGMSGRVSGDIGQTTLSSEGLPEALRAFMLQRGDTLGRYVVLDVLGQGGMGVVYAAYDPELDRKVAIKLVRWAGSSDGPVSVGRSRLLREAQALAKLTHPNVVAVYDVGTWQQSVFVAMELVEGQTVSRWLESHGAASPPPWRAGLEVMIAAGRGLEAAHAVGIVHRDFKPENVMLSSAGRVIVLDFGLARATEGPLSEPGLPSTGGTLSGPSGAMATPLTVTGSVMGTPAYMAPEQLCGRISDASSDQFSFCVALYQALYGVRPFAGKSLPELTRAVLQGAVDPAPRGSRVPAWVRRAVVRGLATEPMDRWPSMTELLAALSTDPARRRSRVLLGLGVVGLLGASWWGATRVATGADPCAGIDDTMAAAWGPARREALERAFRRDAKGYSEDALVRVGESLDGWAAAWVAERHAACEADRPGGGGAAGGGAGRDAGLRAACLDERLGRLDALVRLLGDADQAMVTRAISAVESLPDPTSCRDALAWRRSAPVPDDPQAREGVEALRLRMAEVHALSATGRLKDAAAQAEALLAEARALGYGPAIGEMLFAVGGSRAQLGDFAGALPMVEEGVLLARAHGLERLEADLLSPLVFLHSVYTGRLELAEWHSRVQETLLERLGDPPRDKARALVDRARLERQRGNTDAAIERYERAVALYEQDGGDGPGLVTAYDNLAAAYIIAERYDEASATIERAEALAAEVLGFDHPHRGNLMVQAARIAAARGDHASAVTKQQAALALYDRAYGGQHANIAAVLNGLGIELEALDRVPEARAAYERGLEVGTRMLGPDHRQVSVVKANLGNLLRRQGHAAQAEALHRAVRDGRQRDGGSSAEDRYHVMENHADDLRALGRCDEAEAEYRAALALREAEGEREGPSGAYSELGIGLCQLRRGERARGKDTLEAALRSASMVRAGDDESWQRWVLALVRFSLAVALRHDDPGSVRATELGAQARAYWAELPERAALLRQHGAWAAGGAVTMPVY